MRYDTDYRYTDRKTKAQYVFEKYNSLLKGDILDVGADECYLRDHLSKNSEYIGIGLGGNPDQQVDLENEKIPFKDNTFDCVLCLDVLEHLDNIHDVFDELCRVSKKYVIISLPNPWASLWNFLLKGDYQPGQAMKFYGLPLEKPKDRHKWFFNIQEAESFLLYRAKKNHMNVIQIDCEDNSSKKVSVKLVKVIQSLYLRPLFKSNVYLDYLNHGTIWIVLEKM